MMRQRTTMSRSGFPSEKGIPRPGRLLRNDRDGGLDAEADLAPRRNLELVPLRREHRAGAEHRAAHRAEDRALRALARHLADDGAGQSAAADEELVARAGALRDHLAFAVRDGGVQGLLAVHRLD